MRRPELCRTTTFRLAMVYGAVFAAGIVALLGLVYLSAAVYLTQQMDEIVVGQAQALRIVPPAALPDKFREIEREDSRHVNFCGLFAPNGAWIAGNVTRLPADTPVDGQSRELKAPGF